LADWLSFAHAMTKKFSDKARGLPIAFEHETVADFLDRWLEQSVKPSVHPPTHQQYHQHARLYLKPALGGVRLADLRPQHIQAFINGQLKAQ